MSKFNEGLTKALEELFCNGVTERAIDGYKKDAEKLVTSIQEDLEYRIRDELAMQLTDSIVQMAERAVEAMLTGNEGEMRRWLSCDKRGPDGEYLGWTGRTDGYTGNRSDEDFHPIIHGKIFEQGALALRKKIAEANESLLRDERIRDLEDQIKSLVAQVNKANAEKEEMWQRLRAVA